MLRRNDLYISYISYKISDTQLENKGHNNNKSKHLIMREKNNLWKLPFVLQSFSTTGYGPHWRLFCSFFDAFIIKTLDIVYFQIDAYTYMYYIIINARWYIINFVCHFVPICFWFIVILWTITFQSENSNALLSYVSIFDYFKHIKDFKILFYHEKRNAT